MTSSSIPLPTTRIYMYIYTYISALHRQILITISPPSTIALLTCMMENKLKLNPDKTEALIIGPRQHISTVSSSSRQPVWHHDSLLESVRVSLKATLSRQPHFCFFCFHLRHLSTIIILISASAVSYIFSSFITL